MKQTTGGHGEKFTRQKELAIGSLLSCPTIEKAAEQVGVASITLHRWLSDPDFKADYVQARRQVMEAASARLQAASSAAVETLQAVMADPEAPASAKCTAARTILELGQRASELSDIDVRLEKLEQAAAERGDGTKLRAIS